MAAHKSGLVSFYIQEEGKEAYVSLNGKPATLMIDPNVDLHSVSYDYFNPTKWILELNK